MYNSRLPQITWKMVQSPVVVFAIALTTRLWMFWRLPPAEALRFFYQYNEFARIAWAVVSGHGYSSPWPNTPLLPTAVEPPVYTYLLASIFRLAGAFSLASLKIGVVLNAVLAAATAVLILRIGKRDFGAPVGVLAAWLWSCWTYEAAVSLRLWEGSLSALLLAVGLFLLPRLADSPRASLWGWFGALAGVAALTNTSLLSVFPLFWLWLWMACRRRQRPCGKLLLISVAACVLTVLPWTIRNYVTFQRLMPIRDNFGLELWLGNHESVGRLYDNDFPILNPTEYNRLGEIPFMQAKRQIALQFIRQHPAEFLRLSVRRCFKYWIAPDGSAWWMVSILTWAGAVLALWRRRTSAVPYVIVIVAFPCIYYVTHTFNNYRHPTESAMFLLAAYAVETVVTVAGQRLFRIRPS